MANEKVKLVDKPKKKRKESVRERLERERKQAVWRSWYRRNKEEFNKQRKEKYQDDEEARQKALQQAQKYREERKAGKPLVREMHRVLNGVEVEVFSTGYAADKIGKSRQMVVNWERRGWIPPSSFPEKHRLYTEHQIDLIEVLDEEVERIRSKGIRNIKDHIGDVVAFIQERWDE